MKTKYRIVEREGGYMPQWRFLFIWRDIKYTPVPSIERAERCIREFYEPKREKVVKEFEI